MSAHTPGPWEMTCDGTIDGEPAHWEVSSNGGTVALVNTVLSRGQYDARLIAAAPELLEALKDVMERLVDRHEADESAVKARAAITKATGGEA